ncbi:MAG: GntR family transcriptional regulator [Gammaproteobacteria bacterium]|nr:GntR family transcriptional regulator [Gammaproteobacteria bacterium]
MKFDKIKPARLSETIVEQLEEMIVKGLLKPGDRLPAERELAEQMDVSRPSVREALTRLEVKGLIHSRHGEGTFVTDLLSAGFKNPLVDLLCKDPEAMFDVLELRRGLEELAAGYAAKRATPADRTLIELRFNELLALKDQGELESEAKADAEFHIAIAEASHNVALIHIMRSLFDLLSDHIAQNLERLYISDENRDTVTAQHQDILRAVLSGDESSAREAARTHLTFVAQSMRDLRTEQSRERAAERRLSS